MEQLQVEPSRVFTGTLNVSLLSKRDSVHIMFKCCNLTITSATYAEMQLYTQQSDYATEKHMERGLLFEVEPRLIGYPKGQRPAQDGILLDNVNT